MVEVDVYKRQIYPFNNCITTIASLNRIFGICTRQTVYNEINLVTIFKTTLKNQNFTAHELILKQPHTHQKNGLEKL